MIITIDKQITITGKLPKAVLAEIRKRVVFPNPRFLENKKQGRYNGKTSKDLSFLTVNPETKDFLLPSGFMRDLCIILNRASVNYQIDDNRKTNTKVEGDLFDDNHVDLRDYQIEAVGAIIKRDFGTLEAATGAGKTVIALAVAIKRQVPFLVIIHTKELLNQWVDRINTFMGIPKDEIGIIGAGKKVVGEKATVSLVQTLSKGNNVDLVKNKIGHVIVDECHLSPSKTFIDVIRNLDCKYILGLTATPYRRDKLERIIFLYMGNIVHTVKKENLISKGNILRPVIFKQQTRFETKLNPKEDYQQIIKDLVEDYARNEMIIKDVKSEMKSIIDNEILLVLSDRVTHCQELCSMLFEETRDGAIAILTGQTKKKDREAIIKDLENNKIKVLFATGQLIGTGFDVCNLTILFLTTPVKFSGRLIQYVGRILRPTDKNKVPKVYDYIDGKVGVLANSARERQKIWDKI